MFSKHRQEPTKARQMAETRTDVRLHVTHAAHAADRSRRLSMTGRSTTKDDTAFTHHIRQAAKFNRKLKKLKES